MLENISTVGSRKIHDRSESFRGTTRILILRYPYLLKTFMAVPTWTSANIELMLTSNSADNHVNNIICPQCPRGCYINCIWNREIIVIQCYLLSLTWWIRYTCIKYLALRKTKIQDIIVSVGSLYVVSRRNLSLAFVWNRFFSLIFR